MKKKHTNVDGASISIQTGGANTMICAAAASIPASKVSGLKSSDVHATFPNAAE